ncbi:outer membrane beta-barrel protein [Mucilaginibacter sp. KACC 22063]|uniref:outer membrane beta-barrel protein n=1 Tax=Mucilaginibacter sp. KACC 22063 TaxID=3025666 RepID=UPI00236610DC|nr:outer membrane beta-barrel protein [Mucilaginibacter sp. KACC 22063]WDF56539.1 hypothetical protein PQ461_05680 [Mucilaginibacter sp. KACC 22063]
MKKILLAAGLLTTLTSAVKAQSENYRAFKVDFGAGYASPQGSSDGGMKGGVSFTLQPHYRLSDALAVGLRLEGAVLGRAQLVQFFDAPYLETVYSVTSSYILTGEYYLTDSFIRPFVGMGVGAFTQASVHYESDIDTYAYTVPSKTKFGVVPEAGVEIGHFRLSADYNILPQKTGYLGIKAGFFFGGGSRSNAYGMYHRRRRSENWGG